MNNLPWSISDISNNNPVRNAMDILNLFNINMPNSLDSSMNNLEGPFERNVENSVSPEFTEIFNILTNPITGSALLQNRNLRNILTESFNNRPKFKNVISEKGKHTLKTAIYSKNLNINETCPIWQVDFKEEQEITISPCNHAFTKGALENWLENEKAVCPICRFGFDAKEIRINPEENDDEGSGSEDDNGDENEGEDIEEIMDVVEEIMDVDEQIEDNDNNEDIASQEENPIDVTNEIRNLQQTRNNFLTSFMQTHPFGRNQVLNTVPHSYLSSLAVDNEEDDIRHAIALSLLDQQNNDNSNNSVS